MGSSLPVAVFLCSGATDDFDELSRKDKVGAAHIAKLIRRAELLGWEVAIKVRLITILSAADHIGEIRRDKPGSAHRAIFFWVDDEVQRAIHVTAIAKKSILKPARLQTYIDAAIARRDQFSLRGDC